MIQPARGLIYIRHIATEETYRGGAIVITPKSRDKVAAQQFIVTAIGESEHCDDEDCERPHVLECHVHGLMVGDWVLVRHRSWMATPDPNVYVVRTDDILGKFEESVN